MELTHHTQNEKNNKTRKAGECRKCNQFITHRMPKREIIRHRMQKIVFITCKMQTMEVTHHTHKEKNDKTQRAGECRK